MARDTRDIAEARLEGLILFDGTAYYELPVAVIARYRVPEERRGEVGAPPVALAAIATPWLVHGCIYAPEEQS